MPWASGNPLPVVPIRSCCRLIRPPCVPLSTLQPPRHAPKNNIHPPSARPPTPTTSTPTPALTLTPTPICSSKTPPPSPARPLPAHLHCPALPCPAQSPLLAPQCSVSRQVPPRLRREAPSALQCAPRCSTSPTPCSSTTTTTTPTPSDRLVASHHGLGTRLLIAIHHPALGHAPKPRSTPPATGTEHAELHPVVCTRNHSHSCNG